MGRVVEIIDTTDHQKKIDEVKEWLEEEEKALQKLDGNTSFQMMKFAHKTDWFLDPLVGIFPVVGDLISTIFTLPALHIAFFKLKNLKLSIAIIAVIASDILIGFVPVVGDILDVFNLSNRKAYKMVVGTINQDPYELKRVNKWATFGVIGVLIGAAILWALYEIISSFIKFLGSFF